MERRQVMEEEHDTRHQEEELTGAVSFGEGGQFLSLQALIGLRPS